MKRAENQEETCQRARIVRFVSLAMCVLTLSAATVAEQEGSCGHALGAVSGTGMAAPIGIIMNYGR